MAPVRYEDAGETRVALVGESEVEQRHDHLEWGEFAGELRDRGLLVARHDGPTGEVRVIDRVEAVGAAGFDADRAAMDPIDRARPDSQFTDRAVVERSVVEAVTVESEITDRELVESNTVDAELLHREATHCEVSSVDTTDAGAAVVDAFETGARAEVACDVAVTLEESWGLTTERVERITVESRITGSDTVGGEPVESEGVESQAAEPDTIPEAVDVAGIERTVLESDLVDAPGATDQPVAEGGVESRVREDDAIETHLLRRRVIDAEVSLRREVTGEVVDAETLASETVSRTAVESEIVDAADHDARLVAASAADREAATADAEPVAGDEPATDEPATDESSTAAGRSTGRDRATAEGSSWTEPSEADVGKAVVNAAGDEVGMVAAVEGGRMYVDPHPSITDRIRTALGWGTDRDDSYPVDEDHVARIDDEAVVLGVDRRG